MKTRFSLSLLCCAMSLPVMSQAETLTVYTYDSFASDWGPGPKIKPEFEKLCGCELKFVALDDGVSILNRLRLEGKNAKADVVLGLDDSLIAEAKKTGLLVPNQVSLQGLTVPGGWHDDTFVPFDYGYFAFVYNKDKLKNPPTSLKSLVDDNNHLKIIYQDPRTSTPGQGLLLWIKSVYGNDSATAWHKLAEKTVTVTKGWSEAYSLFLKGESDLVWSYTTSPAYHVIAEQDNRFATLHFPEGNYLQVEVAAMVGTSTHKKLANQFLQFLVSDQVQSVIPTTNWMYPVKKESLPAAFNDLDQPEKVQHFSSQTVADKRNQWIRDWQSAVTF